MSTFLFLRPLYCTALLVCSAIPSIGLASTEFEGAIKAQLDSSRAPSLEHKDFSSLREPIERVYANQKYGALWFSGNELTRPARNILELLRAADGYGLRSRDYEAANLIYAAIETLSTTKAIDAERAHIDMGITVAAARFLKHLHFGRVDPIKAGFKFETPRAPFDLAAQLEALTKADKAEKVVADAEPQFVHYRLLKQALHRYRDLAADSDLTDLPSIRVRSIKPGEPYEGIPALRRLLVALGDLPEEAQTSDIIIDHWLSNALIHFQKRHGLEADGALGRKTFAALKIPISDRVEQLAMSLERWRWLPELSSPPIIVNVPQFRLFAFSTLEDRAADILQMDVIVGKAYDDTQTPIFAADMKYVVFRPFWDVPDSILRKEMLPLIRKDAGYLDKNNLEIVSSSRSNTPPIEPTPAAIAQLSTGAYRLRQRPGPDNSLGLVKLMLPNSHNVYLHSTPAKQLFEKAARAFSHGCIRVADPAALVQHVLRNEDAQWTREKIEAAMEDENPEAQNRHVFLSKTIPVFIVYETAMALENGEVQFFDDIYGHDAKLKKLLK